MLTFSEKAKEMALFYMKEKGNLPKDKAAWGVRIRSNGARFDFSLEELTRVPPMDMVEEVNEIKVILDKATSLRLEGASVDFVETPFSNGFKVELKQGVPAMPAGADLSDPMAKKIQDFLIKEINPSLASHGGMARLLGVKDRVVYLQLGGGCQGCGMANATLKQGIEARLKEKFPEIERVADETDHAGGTNPYYHS